MKYILTASLIILATFCSGQKITVEHDKFLNEKRIESGWIGIKPTLSAPLSVKLRSVGKESVYITLSGANYGANVIGDNATAIFLLEDTSKVIVTSTGIQSYDIGQYGKSYKHQYSILVEDLKRLSETNLISVRKSDTDTYHDFDIPAKSKSKLKELATKFIKELEKL